MFLIFLVYIAALTLEVIGSYMSIVGLASKTGPIIIGLVITLDFAKVIIASVLYKNWHNLNWALRVIFVPVCFILVVVTSVGAYSYILKEFGTITNHSEKEKIVLQMNQEEKTKLEARKLALEEQVSQLPSNYVRQRANLMNTFKPELDEINNRLEVINNEIKVAKTSRFDNSNEEKNSTIGSLAEVYNIPPDQVNKILALFITIMIDPLAIALLTLANFLSSLRHKTLAEAKVKDYVEKTRAEKIKELMFGKNIPIQYPDVKVSLEDIRDTEVPTQNLKVYPFINSCHLNDIKIKDNGVSNFSNVNIVQEKTTPDVQILTENLNIHSFIHSYKLKEKEDSLFEEPLISYKDLEQFKFFTKTEHNEAPNDFEITNTTNDVTSQENEEITNTPLVLPNEDLNTANLFESDAISAVQHSVNNDLNTTLSFDNSKENEDRLDIIVDHLNSNDDNQLDLFLDYHHFTTLTEELETSHIVEELDEEDTGFDLISLNSNPINFDEATIQKEKNIFIQTDNLEKNIEDFNKIEHLWIDDPKVRQVYEREKDTSNL